LNTRECARCGGTHTRIPFFRFKKPVAGFMDPRAWPFWATCPVTKEPLLINLDADELRRVIEGDRAEPPEGSAEQSDAGEHPTD